MHDFIIIGAGIVGMSTAMQLKRAYPDRRMLLVDKESGPARHQTGHNSGVIHAGVYYKPGSSKARFCRKGNQAMREFCDEHSIAYEICGKLLVATNELEMQRIHALWERIGANGISREWVSGDALREMEPKITGLGGIFVADSGIVDFTEVARVMGGEFARMGGEIRYDCAVTALEERRNEVVVHTAQGSFTTRYMVSCSGLMADRLIRMLGRNPGFTICPFRGEYFVLPTEHNQIVRHLIYPIPDPTMPFLGVHLTRMIDGSVTVGPNAVLALKREGYRKRDVSLRDMAEMFTDVGILKILRKHLRFGLTEMKNSLFRRGYLEAVRKYCPSITLADLHPYPSGVRAQAVLPDGTLMDDFLFVSTPRTVNVGNAPSPAATASIPIGAHIVERVKEMTEG